MGGGGGGSNPAAAMTGMFGTNVEQSGNWLNAWTNQNLEPFWQNAVTQEQPKITEMLNTAFDPQQQLYNQTLGQVTDQTRHA